MSPTAAKGRSPGDQRADTMTPITSDRRGPVPPPSFDLSNLDAVRWLQDQPSESIDLLITDPAYESLEKHRAVGTTTRLKHSKASSNDWSKLCQPIVAPASMISWNVRFSLSP